MVAPAAREEGTVTPNSLDDHLITVAVVVPKVTVLLPCMFPKPVPMIFTSEPALPDDAGESF